ncbi:MAG: gliding motility-associated protein GldE [Bacteroidota bacterium]
MDPEPANFLLINSIDWPIVISVISLIILLFLSALISGSEIAFFSLSKTDLGNDENINKNHNIVIDLLSNPQKLLATILISNNFINILFVLIFAYTSDYFFGNIYSKLLRFILEIVLVTSLILLFGEVLPKVYANRNALKFAHFMAKPLKILNVFLTFLSVPLLKLTSVVENRLNKKNSDFSVEVLSQALELTSSNATTKEEKKILHGIVNFGNTETSQVMCPRMDIFALSKDEEYDDVIKKITKNGHSRIPVYEDNIDTIIGILYAKDLIPHINKNNFKWNKIIREPFFVPENKKLDDLLKEFQDMKNHLAIVVDEYGGTSGIIALEDIIEEIVGDISDEFDDQDMSYSKIDENNYIFEGKTTLKDFFKVLQIDDSEFEDNKNEAETLAGFILEITERFPKTKQKITFKEYIFTIEAIDKKRIKQIKVTLPKNR